MMKAEQKPTDQMMLKFVTACPPSYWKGKDGAKPVLDACEKAAAGHIAALREQKKLTKDHFRRYIVEWDGLPTQKALLKEYDEAALKKLAPILEETNATIKRRKLKSFIYAWKVGTAVDRAQAELNQL